MLASGIVSEGNQDSAWQIASPNIAANGANGTTINKSVVTSSLGRPFLRLDFVIFKLNL
jgi:hypothetical protein